MFGLSKRHVSAGLLMCLWVMPASALPAQAEPASSQPRVEADADQILKSMSSYLKGLASFSVNFNSDLEIVTYAGEKLQFSSSGDVVVQRPGQIRATRKGGVVDAMFNYDGKTLTILAKGINAYAQFPIPGTIDDALDGARDETGFHFAGADLLYSDVYPGLNLEVESGRYIGVVMVNGVECHHLAYRAKDIDWQIWLQTGDKPLPLKYVITSKWVTAAPQFTLRLRDWNENPKFDATTFVFSPPEGARKLNSIFVTEAGEIEVPK